MAMDKKTMMELHSLRKQIIEEQKNSTYTGLVKVSKLGHLYIELTDGKKVSLTQSEARKVIVGDKVALSVNWTKKRTLGVVTKILSSDKKIFIGEVYKRGKEFYLSSYDKVVAPIPIKKSFKKLYIGEVVEAEILDNGHPFETGQLSVNVTYSIGNKNHQDIKIKLAKHKYNIVSDVICDPNEYKSKNNNREDLTDLKFFSIDSENTIDVDDALAIEKRKDGYSLYIAIADVSDFIDERSSIEKASIVKTSSLYYPNQVTHMLPERLGGTVLSLNDTSNKNAFVLFVDIDENGNVINYNFREAIINSKAKLSYSEVNYYFKRGFYSKKINNSRLRDSLDYMFELYHLIKDKREEESIVRLYSKFYINQIESGKLIGIIPYDRNTIKSIIEEYMVLANRLAADFLFKNGSGLYKVKADFEKRNIFLEQYNKLFESNIKKVVSLKQNTDMFNYMVNKTSSDYTNKLHENSIKTSVLSKKPIGHYSLGFEHYSSFTSPIRRYSDILVHRYIKYHLGIKGYENPDNYVDSEMVNYLNEKERLIDKSRQNVMHMFYLDYIKNNHDVSNGIHTASIEKITGNMVIVKLIDFGIRGYLEINKEDVSIDEQKIKIGYQEYSLCDVIQVKFSYFNKRAFAFKPFK